MHFCSGALHCSFSTAATGSRFFCCANACTSVV